MRRQLRLPLPFYYRPIIEDTMTDQTPFFEQASDTSEIPERNLYLGALFWLGLSSFVLGVILLGYSSGQYNSDAMTMAIGAGLLPFGGLSMLLWLTVKALRHGPLV